MTICPAERSEAERARTFAGDKPSPSLLRKSTSPERGRFCSTYRKMPKSSPFGGAGRDQRERTERVSRPLGGAGCERSEQTEGGPRRGLNSLSQSLTALTAPSGWEPLAKPRTLHVSREVCRHAKGPIPEGAGTAIAVTGGVSLVTLPYKTAKRPLKM